MTATAYQLRRRLAAADAIVARLFTVRSRKQFIEVAPLVCSSYTPNALHRAIAGYTDLPKLLALADDIAPPKRRRMRRRNTEKSK
ncbi:MAG: hypothetical protein OER92_05445 [Alphaproteobacteria bacterium]|nr:hypothetical protein [Alphaproteobacteria bacterium]